MENVVRIVAAVFSIGFVSAVVAQSVAAGTPTRLTLRLLPTADPVLQAKLFNRLAELAKPTIVRLPPAISVDDLLRQRCGFVSTQLRAALLTQNAGLDFRPQTESRDVVMPPCPYWQFDVPVKVAGALSLNRAMSMATGFAGPRTAAQVAARNPKAFDANSRLVAAPQQALVLPHRSQPFTLFLRDRVGSPADVADRLSTEFPNLLKPVFIDNYSKSSAISLYSAVPTTAAGTCAGRAGAWPFDPDRIATALEANKKLRDPAGFYPKGTIVVADTGLRLAQSTLLPLRRNPGESGPHSRDGIDDDGNGFADDVHGAYMSMRFGFPEPIAEYPESVHGTQVVGMIFGPWANERLRMLLRERIEISIASVVHRDVFGVEQDGRPRVAVHVPASAIERAFNYADAMRPEPVLNVSFRSETPLPALESVFREAPFLTVAAAGNDGENIGKVGKQKYPPEWRRQFSSALITVAAHDGAGRLAPFSNRGRQIVDLAAPGCMVQTTGLEGAQVTASGTSMAAPLVSLTAALLKSEGLIRPADIRNRILATTDFDADLKDTYTSGRLNIEKAVRIYEDIIVLRHADGTVGDPQFGEVSAIDPLQLCEDQIPLRDIVKLIPHYGEAPRPQLLLRRSGHHIAHAQCPAAPDLRLSFRPATGQTARELRLDEVSEFIPALR